MLSDSFSYSKKEVASVSGLTPRTIHFYTDEGLVLPEVSNPVGRGRRRLYSQSNAYEFILVKHLADHGLKLESIKKIMAHLRERFLWVRNRRWLVDPNFGERVFLVIFDATSDSMTIDLRIVRKKEEGLKLHFEMNQSALVIELTHLGEELRI